jgi:shikimate dehydrogenase
MVAAPPALLTFRLLGQGIAYSASPAMHRAAFAALGLPHRYELEDVTADDLPAAVQRLRAVDAGGANVTVPHKAAVTNLVDMLSDVARRVDAVNTVARDGEQLVGHNTDLPATVGAGRAVRLALEDVGASEIVVLQRSDGSMGRLADELAAADLLVNATPVGTGSGESPVPVRLLRPDLAVLDLVYRPSPTRLVRDARAAGGRAEAGGGILLGQAWRSLELWLGRPAPIDVMRTALDAELGGRTDG